MNLSNRRERFRAVLDGKACVRPASVFDPISARIAEDLGYEVGMLAGSVASATVLGAPDTLVLTLTEFVEQVHRICRASSLSLLVDADHGYGNALNVKRTVEELETAGLSALTIEDTLLPQPFGSDGEQLISIDEGVGKMKAALAGRQDTNLVVVGRTSALRIAGTDEAVRRAIAYEKAGVDAIFLVFPQTKADIEAVNEAVRIPLILGGAGPELEDIDFLASKNVRISLQPHLPFQAAVRAVHDTLNALRGGVSVEDVRSTVASPDLLGKVTRKSHYDKWSAEFL